MPIVLKIDTLKGKPYDLTDLKSYGKVEDVSMYMGSPFKLDEYEQCLMRTFRTVGFDPDEDYLAIVGRVINCLFAQFIMLKHFGRVNVLIYSSIESRYVPRTLTLDSPNEQETSALCSA